MATILFIDGENFRFKCKDIFTAAGISAIDWTRFDLEGLLGQVLKGITVDEHRYYAAKIMTHPASVIASQKLQEQQRQLKLKLEKAGCIFIIAGRVRGQDSKDANGNPVVVFKEKGVDVQIAVDMISLAADAHIDTAILASSDSDLQPAIKEMRKRGKEVIYLGFERGLNKGMAFTATRTITIRDAEVLAHYSPR